MITSEQLKDLTPSVFATSPSSKMSDRYSFVPTVQILENFEREGWKIASAKQTGRGIHSLHELRLRNSELPNVGDSLVEAIIRNSHNGMATFSVTAGLHRLVCQNGLTVPTSVCDSFKIRHLGFDMEDVKELTESFANRLPIIQNSVDRMRNRELTMVEKINFIKKAINVRWKSGNVPSELDVMNIVHPRREEDNKNDVWTVFNVIQENFSKGGLRYTSTNGRKTELKGLKSIMSIHQMNVKLWDLAEEFSI